MQDDPNRRLGTFHKSRRTRLGGACLLAIAGVAVASLPFTPAAPAAAEESGLPSIEEIYEAQRGAPRDSELIYLTLQLEVFSAEPDRWGGAYVDGDVLAIVYTNQTASEALQALAAVGISPGEDAVELRNAEHSMADLEAASAAVTAQRRAGVDVVSVGPQYSANRIVVGVDTSSGARSIDADIGAAVESWEAGLPGIEVVAFENPVAEPAATRWYFYREVYGGGRLTFLTASGGSAGTCSVAFGWQSSGLYALSASHCVYSKAGNYRPQVTTHETSTSGDLYGNVTWTSGDHYGSSNSPGDIARITPTPADPRPPAGRVWVGDGDTRFYRELIGQAEMPEGWTGSTLRTSGSSGYLSGNPNDGETAPDWVPLVDQMITYADWGPVGHVYTGMTIAEHVESCIIPGDSGGAVHLLTGNFGSYAVGIISGSKIPAPGPANCRTYYTPISVITAALGGSVLT